MNIIILDDYQDAVRKLKCASRLDALNAKVFTNTVKGIGQLSVRLRDADVLVLIRERTHFPKQLLEKLPKLKLISQTGRVGAHIDVDACTKLGIAVAEGVGSPVAPAELTWALIMAAMRRLPQYIGNLKHGAWQQSGLKSAAMPPNFGIGMVLKGKTLGIWGYGRIGQLVAGYGKAFGNAIHHAYPGYDYDDLMSAVDAVIARGYVDPARLYVTGGSGGGVLTAWIVGKTDRFRAAVVQKPVINWTSFALTADMYTFFWQYWFPGLPWEQPQQYWARSPLSLVGNVKTPTMVLTGEDDHRTPMSESEQYYQALQLRRVPTALVRMPGAPHALDKRPSQLASKVAHVLAWFERH